MKYDEDINLYSLEYEFKLIYIINNVWKIMV